MQNPQRVVIVGVGLIGSSIGLTLRAGRNPVRILGLGRSQERLDEARALGAIDEGTTDPRRALANADVAVICTPVSRIAADVVMAVEHGPDSLLVTDAGSTKCGVVAEVEKHRRAAAAFVGAHPLAGSERSGASAGRPGLFDGRVCVLTPTPRTAPDRLERARAFWTSLGCRIVELDPAEHDRLLALTSHLPNAVAAALAATVPIEALDLAAGAYRDGTRVAAAETSLWTSIFLANRQPLITALHAFQAEIATLLAALDARDEPALRAWWDEARHRRLLFDPPTTAHSTKER